MIKFYHPKKNAPIFKAELIFHRIFFISAAITFVMLGNIVTPLAQDSDGNKRDFCIRDQYKIFLNEFRQGEPLSSDLVEAKIKYWLALAKVYHYGDFSLVDAKEKKRDSIYLLCDIKIFGRPPDPNGLRFLSESYFMQDAFSDSKLALYYYQKAHEAGDPNGTIGLTHLNMRGEGTPKNLSNALSFALNAAKKGSADGQFLSGILYAGYDGEAWIGKIGIKGGLAPNLVLSYMWLNIAAVSGDKDASGWRKDVEKEMSNSELKRAQIFSSACFISNFKYCADGSMLDYVIFYFK